jgi:hypothetical protein
VLLRGKFEARNSKSLAQTWHARNEFDAIASALLKRRYLVPIMSRQGRPKWFDRLTILSKVEGQFKNSNFPMS